MSETPRGLSATAELKALIIAPDRTQLNSTQLVELSPIERCGPVVTTSDSSQLN